MNKLTLLGFLTLSAGVPAFAQIPESESLISIFSQDSDISITRGMTRETVEFLLSIPNETVTTNLWVYWNFTCKSVPIPAKYDTLVVVFSEGRVSAIRLCESQPVRELIAKLKSKTGAKIIAAK